MILTGENFMLGAVSFVVLKGGVFWCLRKGRCTFVSIEDKWTGYTNQISSQKYELWVKYHNKCASPDHSIYIYH